MPHCPKTAFMPAWTGPHVAFRVTLYGAHDETATGTPPETTGVSPSKAVIARPESPGVREMVALM